MKRLIAILVLMVWALSLAPAALAEDEIKIGLLLPITGPAAPYGQAALQGIRLAQEHKPTVLGKKVKIMLADNRSDKIEASTATARLIQRDEVAAIIGALSSSTTMAAAPVAEKAGVPLISGWATNPIVTRGKKYVFRTCFIDPFQGRVGANFALKHLGAKTAAMIVDISRDYSVGLSAFFKRAFTAGGGKVVLRTMYTSGDQEFSAQLGTIKAKNPDLIYLPGYSPELPLIIRQAREMGLKQPFLGGDAMQADEVLKIGGPAVEGIFLTTHFDEQGTETQAGKRYATAFRAKYKKSPDAMGALGYDAYMMVLAAIEKAGSVDADKIVAALGAIKGFKGVCGVTDIVGRDAVRQAVILTVKDGKYVYVTSVKP